MIIVTGFQLTAQTGVMHTQSHHCPSQSPVKSLTRTRDVHILCATHLYRCQAFTSNHRVLGKEAKLSPQMNENVSNDDH